jgi:hypothetical protein
MSDLEMMGIVRLGDRKRLMQAIKGSLKEEESKGAGGADAGTLHLAVLQAQPLCEGEPKPLDFPGERLMLCDSFRECGRQMAVRFCPATTDNLLKMITKGVRALHISGHGDPSRLVLEDGKGGLKALDVTTLKMMLMVGGQSSLRDSLSCIPSLFSPSTSPLLFRR